jgi:hypothetical protein
MHPAVSEADVLRMFPASDQWSEDTLRTKATALRKALRQAQRLTGPRSSVSTLPALIPYIVCGRWAWPEPLEPSHWLEQAAWSREGTHVVLRQQAGAIVPGLRDDDPISKVGRGLPRQPAGYPPPFGAPVWLGGHPPTVETLCQVADDVRDTLQRLMEEWPLVSLDTYRLIDQEIAERLTLGLVMRDDFTKPPQERTSFAFTEAIRGNDYRAYCFWQVARLLVHGHVWRLAHCIQCGHVFLKTRQDPPGRPSRFCRDACRQAWHNPRRAMRGRSQ